MNPPICRPLMDAASPQCRCLQCSVVRTLRPRFPGIVALQLSPDKSRLALINVDDIGWELWMGTQPPRDLQRRWVAGPQESFGCPVFSPDGGAVCVPLLGRHPGLYIVEDGEGPRRITHGLDLDPRWSASSQRVCYYRVGDKEIELLFVDVRLSGKDHLAA